MDKNSVKESRTFREPVIVGTEIERLPSAKEIASQLKNDDSLDIVIDEKGIIHF